MHTLRLFVSNAVMLEGEAAEVVETTVSLSKCYNCPLCVSEGSLDPGREEGEPGVKRSACTAAGGFEYIGIYVYTCSYYAMRYKDMTVLVYVVHINRIRLYHKFPPFSYDFKFHFPSFILVRS